MLQRSRDNHRSSYRLIVLMQPENAQRSVSFWDRNKLSIQAELCAVPPAPFH